MNEQERQVIADIFRRLEQAANQPRDPEAERFIAERLQRQPYAPYAMAQTVYVQEQALAKLNAEVERLRAEVEQARRQPQGGGFLSGLFGGGAREPQPAAPTGGTPWSRAGRQSGALGQQAGGTGFGQGPQPQGPWGGAARGGGGFLQTALGTAAGVAGGMMLGSALSNAFGGSDAAGGGAQAALSDAAAGGADAAGGEGITDSLYQDASLDDQTDFGSDLGGDGGDWA
jgi:hypothetical protein